MAPSSRYTPESAPPGTQGKGRSIARSFTGEEQIALSKSTDGGRGFVPGDGFKPFLGRANDGNLANRTDIFTTTASTGP